MILINESPPQTNMDLGDLYYRMSLEGLVHSTPMRGETYEPADNFNEDWAIPSITWSAGGKETYRFDDGRALTMSAAGALTIATGTRYAYKASDEAPFYSNMIAFPRWMEDAATKDALNEKQLPPKKLSTRLIRPGSEVESLMLEIVAACRAGAVDPPWYLEKSSLLYAKLLQLEHGLEDNYHLIEAKKMSTKKELARRIDRAQQHIIEHYNDPALDLSTISRAACLSQFHLIRVFKSLLEMTPMQFLANVRMDAARRLVQDTRKSATEIASLVGFSNRAAFSRAFRRRYGVSPLAMRAA